MDLPMSLSTFGAGPSRQHIRSGSWRPLPYILSGFVTYPYRPAPTSPTSPISGTVPSESPRLRFTSTLEEVTSDKVSAAKSNPYEVPLEVGDEFFAFEEYRSAPGEDGSGDTWFRGYVVQAVSLQNLTSPSSSSSTVPYPKPEPSVLIGIFPSSCVHVRPEATMDDGSLALAYEKAARRAEEQRTGNEPYQPAWGEMEAVKEEEEEEEANKIGTSQPNGHGVGSPEGGMVVDINSNTTPAAKRQSISGRKRPNSLVLEKSHEFGLNGVEPDKEDKDQPPLPRLTAGDSTIAGQQWPLVDEISCAIREWYGRLPTYLANRDYRLFSTVIQHIDALFLGRRQLLSQTLSGDELIRVRRECVSRLVKCNVAQGLEVIVRSLEDGSVLVVDKNRMYSGANWISGITCYVYQVQLAYIDLIPLDTLLGVSSSLLTSTKLPPTVSLSRRPDPTRPLSLFPRTSTTTSDGAQGGDHHLMLDIRAFIANPCAPGETAELFFSLYNHAESRFVTEEFCVILNHLGSPARESEQRLGRLRTLFTDLKSDDLSNSVYLVCRLVRNGALKMRNEATAGTLESMSRGGSVAHGSSYLLSENNTIRGVPSIAESTTDDSFSVTSGFGAHRTNTIETSVTAPGSIVDGRPSFRRPLGCAVIGMPQLGSLLADGGDNSDLGSEHTMPIFVPKDEATFANLHEDVIKNKSKEFFLSQRAEAIAVSLKAYRGPLQQVTREHPSVLLDIPLSSRLGFPDVVQPATFRNDLYVKLWSASFFPTPTSNGGSIRMRRSVVPANHGDVQITIEVRRADGTVIPDAIVSGGSGEPPVTQYQSLVFHHNDKPTYGEIIKVSLPGRSEDCHLYLAFRSRGKDRHLTSDHHELEKPFGFAYLPLIQNSSTIKDGSHDLVLYKLDRQSPPSPHSYFDAPAVEPTTPISPTASGRSMIPLRDRLMLRTYLCSNLHTQDDTLRSLLSWQTQLSDLNSLASTLQMFGFVNEEEIAKFVPRTLDALYGIMVSNLGDRQDEFEYLVFQALIKVLAMTADRRFTNFTGVLDTYISTQFNHPASCFHLLHSMKLTMSKPNTKDHRSFLKVWHLFFRFIIRARELDRARGIGLDETSKHIEADFQRQTKAILVEINNLMSSSDKSLIGTQTLAVQHYADILPDLAQVFPPLEIAELIIAFADTLTLAKGSIAIYKLLLLLQVVKFAFDTSEARALLVPAIVRWVKPHLSIHEAGYGSIHQSREAADDTRVKWLQCDRLAVTVVAWTVNKLQEWYSSPLILEDQSLRLQEEDNLEYCLTLLPTLLESYVHVTDIDTVDALHRHRSTSSAIFKTAPDVFPMSYPFSLISELPPPSLLSRQNVPDDTVPSAGTLNSGAVESAVVVFNLILSVPRMNLLRWLKELIEIEGLDFTSRILRSTFGFCLSILKSEPFPSQWLSLNLMCLGAIIRLLDPITELLVASFIPSVDDAAAFDTVLWTSVFELLCEFCGSPELILEDHTQQRRRAQWIMTGDLRDEGTALLARLWNAIGWEGAKSTGMRYGGYQTRFTSFAGKILGLCMSSHDGICETAVEILFSMIYAEFVLGGKFDSIQSEIFLKLDGLFLGKGTSTTLSDATSRAYFVAQLRAVFESYPSTHPNFNTHVVTFLDEIELFIDLLLTLRDLPENVAWKDERCLALYRLMTFTKRIQRPDLYIRFIHQLVAICLETRDHVGVGFALRLHADLFEWKLDGGLLDVFSAGHITLPAQNQFSRKESLYYHAMHHFAEAEAYETALELCQELTFQHQRMTFSVPKLSELLVHQARLWEKIGGTSRPRPEYFRVAYFGEASGLDKGKDYVVRGQPWEGYSDFCESIQLKHPTAMIHRSKIPPSEFIRRGDEPVIWVTSLQAEPDRSLPVFADGVSENVQSYWRYNGVKNFTSQRPYLRDQAMEAVLSWTEKTILTTAETLPGLLSRSEVVDIRYEQVSPVATALSEVRKATRSLRVLSTGTIDAKQLGNAINGAVDSPVSGGVKLYRTTFFDPSYLDEHPADGNDAAELGSAIQTYVKTISDALNVHRGVCKDIAYHEALRSHFTRSFPDEIARLPASRNSALDAPLPPLPNGHGETLDVPLRSSSHVVHSSTSSNGPGSGYALPALRLGPTTAPPQPPSASPSIVTSSPQPDEWRPSSAPVTATSSPKQSVTSGRGGSRLSSNTSPSGVPSLGSRALSVVGSIAGSGSRRSRDSISVISEGTVGLHGAEGQSQEEEQTPNGGGGGLSRNGTLSKKGLKRLSSLIRR